MGRQEQLDNEMKEISGIIKNTISSNIDWAFSMFYLVIDVLKSAGIQVSFWEEEENWGSILVNNKTIGYIWKKYPLIIIEKEGIPNFKNMLAGHAPINFIEVDSLGLDLFRLDDGELKGYFDSSIDFDSFTMEDLWFNTNSV